MIVNTQIRLQVCSVCGQVQYPRRELCSHCLSDELPNTPVDARGRLLAWTTIRVSLVPKYGESGPWSVGSVKLNCGPVIIVQLSDEIRVGAHRDVVLSWDEWLGRAAMWVAHPG